MKGNLVGHFIYEGSLFLEQVDELLSVNAVMILGQKLEKVIHDLLNIVNLPAAMFDDFHIIDYLIENQV